MRLVGEFELKVGDIFILPKNLNRPHKLGEAIVVVGFKDEEYIEVLFFDNFWKRDWLRIQKHNFRGFNLKRLYKS